MHHDFRRNGLANWPEICNHQSIPSYPTSSNPDGELTVISFLDQRSTERYKVNSNTACDFASPVLEDFEPVNVVNISTTGVGFTTTEKVQVDLVFIIRLVNPPRKFARLALIHVAKVSPQSD